MVIGFWMAQLNAAELASTMPFSSGTYGFTRLAMGRACAVLVAFCELIMWGGGGGGVVVVVAP